MAGKKSFTAQQNPALSFISVNEDEPQEKERKNSTSNHQPEMKQNQQVKETGFSNVRNTEVPDGFKINPLYLEKRSRRIQLVVQPSLYEAIKAKATAEGVSVNELIHTILEQTVKGNG